MLSFSATLGEVDDGFNLLQRLAKTSRWLCLWASDISDSIRLESSLIVSRRKLTIGSLPFCVASWSGVTFSCEGLVTRLLTLCGWSFLYSVKIHLVDSNASLAAA